MDIFQARARTFWFAARFLPADRRDAVAGLYAFARAVDDLVDEPPTAYTPDRIRAELDAWRAWLDRPLDRPAPDPRIAAALAPALVAHRVPPAYLHLLVDGVASDLSRQDVPSWPDLRGYCVQVASSVGLAMCHLLGAGDNPAARSAAVELGIAMQLTNILRDVGSDLRTGRLYLPLDELAGHGYSRERLVRLATRADRRDPGAVDGAWRHLMRLQVARAREHYARGLDGVRHLPAECRLAILLAGRLYRAILDDLEAADYDVFTRRAGTSTARKLAEAARCALLLRLPARSPSATPTWLDDSAGPSPVDALPLVQP